MTSRQERVPSPLRHRDASRSRGAIDPAALILGEPDGQVRGLPLFLRERRAPHALGLHGASVCASAASSNSSILQTVDATPAAMAGVQRSVE
jgi:hypothetical protein